MYIIKEGELTLPKNKDNKTLVIIVDIMEAENIKKTIDLLTASPFHLFRTKKEAYKKFKKLDWDYWSLKNNTATSKTLCFKPMNELKIKNFETVFILEMPYAITNKLPHHKLIDKIHKNLPKANQDWQKVLTVLEEKELLVDNLELSQNSLTVPTIIKI